MRMGRAGKPEFETTAEGRRGEGVGERCGEIAGGGGLVDDLHGGEMLEDAV